MTDSTACIIVDAYSTGNQLAPHFRKCGLVPVHIQSTISIPPMFAASYRPEQFDLHYVYDGDVRALARRLAALDPAVVIAGAESGVELAEELAEQLRLPRNADRLRPARRNKYFMNEALRHANIPAVDQIFTTDLSELESWSRHYGWPVVLKPTLSWGSDGVCICTTIQEVRDAFFEIQGVRNKNGHMNKGVLAQAYLAGQQYIVNAISENGRHYITDIWEDSKERSPSGRILYKHSLLIPSSHPRYSELSAYTLRVLDALGVLIGPTHTELMLTANGPILIECAARAMGLALPEEAYRAALGYSIPNLTVAAYRDPSILQGIAGTPYALFQYLCVAFVNSLRMGKMRDPSAIPEFTSLRSLYSTHWRVRPGQEVAATHDTFSYLGYVTLLHKDDHVLRKELEQLYNIDWVDEISVISNMPCETISTERGRYRELEY